MNQINLFVLSTRNNLGNNTDKKSKVLTTWKKIKKKEISTIITEMTR